MMENKISLVSFIIYIYITYQISFLEVKIDISFNSITPFCILLFLHQAPFIYWFKVINTFQNSDTTFKCLLLIIKTVRYIVIST